MKPLHPKHVPLFPGQGGNYILPPPPGKRDMFDAAKAAAEAWAAAVAMLRPKKKLNPSDENTYYIVPVTTKFTLTANVDTMIAQYNPMRMILAMSVPAGQAGGIFVKPGAAVDPTLFDGLSLISTTQPLILTQDSHKILAQTEWHAMSATTGSFITVVESILRDYPPVPL